MDMEDMVFDSLDDLNCVQMEEVNAENRKPFEGLPIPGTSLYNRRKRDPPTSFD